MSDVKLEIEEIQTALEDVIKRELLEGEKADAARKKVARSAATMFRIKKDQDDEEKPAETAAVVLPQTQSKDVAEKP